MTNNLDERCREPTEKAVFLHFHNSQLCSLEMLVMPMFRVARSSSIILVSYSRGFLSFGKNYIFKPFQYGAGDTDIQFLNNWYNLRTKFANKMLAIVISHDQLCSYT